MKIIDNETYQEFVDKNSEYDTGKKIINFAIEWANLMEDWIEKGYKIEDVAKETSHEADTENISGSMYGFALHFLLQCWKYGEQLKEWHNNKYLNPDDEPVEGVINPTVM